MRTSLLQKLYRPSEASLTSFGDWAFFSGIGEGGFFHAASRLEFRDVRKIEAPIKLNACRERKRDVCVITGPSNNSLVVILRGGVLKAYHNHRRLQTSCVLKWNRKEYVFQLSRSTRLLLIRNELFSPLRFYLETERVAVGGKVDDRYSSRGLAQPSSIRESAEERKVKGVRMEDYTRDSQLHCLFYMCLAWFVRRSAVSD